MAARSCREFQVFYAAFLAWRQSNRWDNEMADHLPELFRSAGLTNIESRVQDEISERGDADFTHRVALWSEVIESLGGRSKRVGFAPGPSCRKHASVMLRGPKRT